MLPELCAGTELSPDDLPLALAGIDHTSPYLTKHRPAKLQQQGGLRGNNTGRGRTLLNQ